MTSKLPFEMPQFVQRQETYVGADKAAMEKDIYVFFRSVLDVGHAPWASMLDVGCATGDLLAYVARHFPEANLCGLDMDENLIRLATARPELSNADFLLGDGATEQVGRFDIVTCFGVLGIFDDFEGLIENLLANTAPRGRVFIHGLLNPDDIDVRIAYKDNLNGKGWSRGFNIFSRKRVADWAADKGLATQFHDFHMTADLPKRPNLPHRAHTVDLADGTRMTRNGLCLLLPETLLEIRT